MSYVVVGCDVNQGNDSEVQNTVAKALEKQGHTVEKLAIKPGPFAAYDWGENGKNPRGKIGVYIIADGIFSIADRYNNPNGFKYVYFIIRGDLVDRPRMRTRKDFETRPIGADGDCTGICEKIRGKTFVEIDKIVQKRCRVLFGANAKEMADELIKAMGGETSEKKSKSSDTGSSIKESLKKAVKKWDGEVEIRLVGDTVYVNKIPDPTSTKLTLSENDNVLYDSVTVNDVAPDTINTLILTYKGYELKLTDSSLINRFGKITKKITAPSSVKSLDVAKQHLNREWNKIRRNNGRQVELKVPGDPKWQSGKWVHVFLPSFFINDYMYITKISSDEDGTGNWSINLCLVDYPPSFTSEEASS